MSNVNEIRFAVEKSVLDIGVKIVFPVIEGIDNTKISPEWMKKRKEIIINLGKIVVNDQVLNDFPIIDLKNPSKYDIPLTENILNNDDFFTAIKENDEMNIDEEEEKKEIIPENFILNIDENIFNNLLSSNSTKVLPMYSIISFFF